MTRQPATHAPAAADRLDGDKLPDHVHAIAMAREQTIVAIAQLLGDPTGRCPECHRLLRLGDGLVPYHRRLHERRRRCHGGGEPPAKET